MVGKETTLDSVEGEEGDANDVEGVVEDNAEDEVSDAESGFDDGARHNV